MPENTGSEGVDSTCQFELNRQIQGIQARLSQAENNITAHYVAMSTFMEQLIAESEDAGTKAVAAVFKATVFDHLNTAVFMLYQKLVNLIDPAAFKSLMMEMAAGLIDGMVGELEAIIGQVESVITGAIDSITSMISDIEAQIAAIEEQLLDAANMPAETVEQLTQELEGLSGSLTEQIGKLTSARSLLKTSTSFLGSQKNAAGCKSATSVLSN